MLCYVQVFRVSRIQVAKQLIQYLGITIAGEGADIESGMLRSWMNIEFPLILSGQEPRMERIIGDPALSQVNADEELGEKIIEVLTSRSYIIIDNTNHKFFQSLRYFHIP